MESGGSFAPRAMPISLMTALVNTYARGITSRYFEEVM
jgi:hypothetical protein